MYILEVGRVAEGLARHLRVTMPDGSSRRALLSCLEVPLANDPKIPGIGNRFPYEHFHNPTWPMRYDFARKTPIINRDHVSPDDDLMVQRAIAPFEHVPNDSTAKEKALELYREFKIFAVGLGTVLAAAPVVDENYKAPEGAEGPKDHLMRVALKMLFESRLIQRDMSKIVKLKGLEPSLTL